MMRFTAFGVVGLALVERQGVAIGIGDEGHAAIKSDIRISKSEGNSKVERRKPETGGARGLFPVPVFSYPFCGGVRSIAPSRWNQDHTTR
jgi:hypothetical protein